EEALAAYIEASTSEDVSIREEAYFQSVAIHVKLEQYSEAIKFADDYLNDFSSLPRSTAVQNLIAQSYLKTSNYDLAISHLQKTGNTTDVQQQIYQKVTYLKATLSFNDGDFPTAKQWFTESLKFTPDVELKNLSYYHLAEISIRLNQYEDAIRLYKSQSRLDEVSNYGIGYALFNQRRYQEAIPYFSIARDALDKNISQDATARLADCLYATKSYKSALELYDRLLGEIQSSYLHFQKGMTQKGIGKNDEAIKTFEEIYQSNKYGSEALFQSGMIYFESARFSLADKFFTQVIEKHPNATSVIASTLNRGISRKNKGELEKAAKDYETVLDKYMDNEAALNAILGLQELEQAGLNIPKLEQYIDQYKLANPESGSLSFVEFESAKRKYFNFLYDQAAKDLEEFLKEYPTSSNIMEAKYYLADSYFRLGQMEKAFPFFNELKKIRNQFTGRVLNRLGETSRELGKEEAAKEAYQLLLDLNLTPKDDYNAMKGLMTHYFDNEAYDQAIQMADRIISSDWKPINGEREATLVKARSLFRQNILLSAKAAYQELAEGNDVYAAESNYHLGLIAFKEDDYETSLDILFDLNA
ncbi:MAG: tetratricopeptide repeat protein, partial [Bacteroidota bacterium]